MSLMNHGKQNKLRRRRAIYRPALEALEDRCLLAAALALDINTNTLGSYMSNFTNVNGTLFFVAGTPSPQSGGAPIDLELWKSDGTTEGTMRVKDINPGSASAFNPDLLNQLANVNGTLFFTAFEPTTGRELWKSDGTPEGTVLVRDIRPGPASMIFRELTNINGTLFFQGDPTSIDRELWKSDGTADGTVLVRDINPGPNPSDAGGFTEMNGLCYFVAFNPAAGRELWKSDGTTAGTVLVKDITPGVANSVIASLINVNGTLFFTAGRQTSFDPFQEDVALWKSDGTAAGTVEVKNVADFRFSRNSVITEMTNLNGTLFFSGGTRHPSPGQPTVDSELWMSDGTRDGTVRVRDINPDSSSSPSNLVNVNGVLLFSANDGIHGAELWRSDGTAEGTQLVKDIRPGTAAGFAPLFSVMPQIVNGRVFFGANDGISGTELWQSDGTAAGTFLVKDVAPGSSGTFLASTDTGRPPVFVTLGDRLAFGANDGFHGFELWRSDGTADGTVMVKDINTQMAVSAPQFLTNVNGTLFFSAENTSSGRELWKSVMTPDGPLTVLVKDIQPGAIGSSPRELTNVNGTLFFAASTPGRGVELWKSDGTAEGTVQVRDLSTPSDFSVAWGLKNVNGRLFFAASTPQHGIELWTSDGTSAGTRLVRDIRLGSASAFREPSAPFTEVNGFLFFVADNGTHGEELWRTDGTELGTMLVKDIRSGTTGAVPRDLTEVNGRLLFSAETPEAGRELWRSDGTTEGTVLVKDIWPGPGRSIETLGGPSKFTNVNGTLFFSASAPDTGAELWKSDGTAEGTHLVKDTNPGVGGISISSAVNVNGSLFFAASAPGVGIELWKSDGTEEGTLLVKDIAPFESSRPSNLTNVNGILFFVAGGAAFSNRELWRSDGTDAGTFEVQDIRPGSASSFPDELTLANDVLLFVANDGIHGTELWFLPLDQEDPEDSGGDPGVPMTSLAPVALPPSDVPDTPDAWLSARSEEPIPAVEPDPNSRDAFFQWLSNTASADALLVPQDPRAKPAPLAVKPRGLRLAANRVGQRAFGELGGELETPTG